MTDRTYKTELDEIEKENALHHVRSDSLGQDIKMRLSNGRRMRGEASLAGCETPHVNRNDKR